MRSHTQAVASPTDTDVRCPRCRTLLAKLEGARLSIVRGDLRARIDGAFRAGIDCYRCRTAVVLTIGPKPIREPGSGP
jgi:hypothetical protein